jgi:hypothetical protein
MEVWQKIEHEWKVLAGDLWSRQYSVGTRQTKCGWLWSLLRPHGDRILTTEGPGWQSTTQTVCLLWWNSYTTVLVWFLGINSSLLRFFCMDFSNQRRVWFSLKSTSIEEETVNSKEQKTRVFCQSHVQEFYLMIDTTCEHTKTADCMCPLMTDEQLNGITRQIGWILWRAAFNFYSRIKILGQYSS